MVNKEPASSSSRQPATLNPDMSREILGLLKAQGLDGVDLDAEALQVLTQFAGKEFKEIYKRISVEKAKEHAEQQKKSADNTENTEIMEEGS